MLYKDKCHFINSLLLENLRTYPIADTLPHQAADDTTIDGHHIKKGTVIQGSLTAIMHDPRNFPNPSEFIPTRFLDEAGKFQNDIRVCPFSIGLRNCVGKQLAITQYFVFSTEIIKRFRIIKHSGGLNPVNTSSTLRVEPMKISFVSRE